MMAPEPPAGGGTGGSDAVHKYWAVKARLSVKMYQRYLDMTNPFPVYRWVGTSVLALLFAYRVIHLHGWYLVAYSLCIYLLNLFLGFLTPKFDPAYESLDNDSDLGGAGPSLPTTSKDEEFRPFIRRLPEFSFWYSATIAVTIALSCSLFRIFDIPVFWPILVIYFIILFTITMKRQIRHMIKHKYVPFDFGKKKYTGRG